MPNPNRIPNVTIEGARLLFRNFSGKADSMNAAGNRNFCTLLDSEVAKQMASDGWNVKYLKAKEEGDVDQPYIQVKVNFKGRPPRVVLITSRGRTSLGEDEVSMLDWAEIVNADLILSPYRWEMRGNSGITAYLQDLFITIQENELDRKYADVPMDSAMNAVVSQNPTSFFDED
jgi:hypothetical protein